MVALCDQCETVTLCSRRGECLPVVGEKQNQGKSLGQIFCEAAYPQKTKLALWDFAPSGGQLICERGAQAVAAYVKAKAVAIEPMQLLAKTHTGMRVDYSGLLSQCQQSLMSATNHANAEMLRQLQGHLKELGGRWYAGDIAVVDEILQLYCIESEARNNLTLKAAS